LHTHDKLIKHLNLFKPTEFYLNSDYQRQFHLQGIDSFTSLMTTDQGTVVSCSSETEIKRLTLKDKDQTTLFIKRTLYEPFNRSIAMFFRLALPRTRSLKELQMLKRLRAHGFPCMIPVAWGERRVLGLPIIGVLVVKEVKGNEFEEAFLNTNNTEKCRLIKQLGELLGRLNNEGFFHILRLKDIIIADNNDDYWGKNSLVLIDREVAKPWPRKFNPNNCCYCLARCYAKFIREKYILTPKQLIMFIDAYLQEIKSKWQPARRELFKRITKYLKKILKNKRYEKALEMVK